MKQRTALALVLALLLCCGGCQSGGSDAAEHVLGQTGDPVSQDVLKPVDNHETIGYQQNAPEKGEEIAVITMADGGQIKLRFFPDEAPKAVYSFKRHAIEGYYDGLTFHRIVHNFMIQSGDPEGTGSDGESVWGETFADEFASNLLNIDGAVSMANRGADTNGSQFFINCTGGAAPNWDTYDQGFEVYQQDRDAFTSAYGRWIKMDLVPDEMRQLYNEKGGNPHLDGYYSTVGLGHTVFAQVFEGMDVVERISQVELEEDGQTPLQPVVIEKVEIVTY